MILLWGAWFRHVYRILTSVCTFRTALVGHPSFSLFRSLCSLYALSMRCAEYVYVLVFVCLCDRIYTAILNGCMGDEIIGDEIMGDEIIGDEIMGDEIIGDEIIGDEIIGDEIMGDEIMGDEIMGDEIMGDEIGQPVTASSPCLNANSPCNANAASDNTVYHPRPCLTSSPASS